jgi:2-methylfumaryl-CoA isomerase
MGHSDGRQALDYTVNSAVGVPLMTGPAELGDRPINHVLPAWDLLTGAYAAFALLAVERLRRETGVGQEVRIPLSDIAITSLANLGQVGEVLTAQANRPRLGNDVFGAYGRDFLTKDGRRLMIMALTPRQWAGLIVALAIQPEIRAIESRRGISFAKDEGLRFAHRSEITPLIDKAVASRLYEDLRRAFDAHDVCWGPYQTLLEAASADNGLVHGNAVFATVQNPSGQLYPIPGSAATLPSAPRRSPLRAPRLGEHTDEVLEEVMGFSAATIGRLHDRGIVASASNREDNPSHGP